ncbi:MAG: Dabb family protein [Bulleidia sp.]
MIRHICMFKLKEENHQEIFEKAMELAQPLKKLPQALCGDVVVNSEKAPANNYDLCLIFDFNTMDDLDAYQADPVHLEFKNYVVANMVSRACIDHEI